MNEARLRRSEKLRKTADFQRVYRRRCAASDNYLLVYAADHDGKRLRRVGVSVSRKRGNAVRRNRIKRQLREAFRLNKAALPEGVDLVLIPKTSAELSVAQWSRSLRILAQRVVRKLRKRGTGNADRATEVQR